MRLLNDKEIEVKPRNFKLVDRLEAHLKEINNE